MGIDLYSYMGSQYCRAVLLTADVLGIQLNIKPLNLMKKEQLSPDFIKLNPQHTVPTLVDNGFVLWESSAISAYLVDQYGKSDSLYPKDVKKRAVVNQRLFFNAGTLYPTFEYYYPMFKGSTEFDQEKYKKIGEAFQFLEGFLEGQEYVAGDKLTIADLALAASVVNFDGVQYDLAPFKNVTRWYAKVQKEVPRYEEINGKKMLTEFMSSYMEEVKKAMKE